MRDWCGVFDCLADRTAERLGARLIDLGADVDVDKAEARVWCFGATEAAVLDLTARVNDFEELFGPPRIRVWSEEHQRYVDPEAPDEDPDSGELLIDAAVAPHEVTWRVRLELVTVFAFRAVRRELPALSRPVIGTGNRHIDLGARDEADAGETALRAQSLPGVAYAVPSAIQGRLRRWWIRQRLAGNYSVSADGSGPGGYDFSHLGWGGGGGGDGGGGGHGGGGHGGHS
jgi:uncharacterized membrane protein YgcG